MARPRSLPRARRAGGRGGALSAGGFPQAPQPTSRAGRVRIHAWDGRTQAPAKQAFGTFRRGWGVWAPPWPHSGQQPPAGAALWAPARALGSACQKERAASAAQAFRAAAAPPQGQSLTQQQQRFGGCNLARLTSGEPRAADADASLPDGARDDTAQLRAAPPPRTSKAGRKAGRQARRHRAGATASKATRVVSSRLAFPGKRWRGEETGAQARPTTDL